MYIFLNVADIFWILHRLNSMRFNIQMHLKRFVKFRLIPFTNKLKITNTYGRQWVELLLDFRLTVNLGMHKYRFGSSSQQIYKDCSWDPLCQRCTGQWNLQLLYILPLQLPQLSFQLDRMSSESVAMFSDTSIGRCFLSLLIRSSEKRVAPNKEESFILTKTTTTSD